MIGALSIICAIAAVFFGYKIYDQRRIGKKFNEIKVYTYSFIFLLALLWAINIYIGFFSN